MITNLKRVLNFALTDFYRNKGVSVASVFVLTITILLLTGIFYMQGMTGFLIKAIESKIDITAYFKADTPEEDILQVKEKIKDISPDIRNVEYISRAEALQTFAERHKDSRVLSRALIEVGDNPFLPALNINTSGKAEQYEQVSEILQNEEFDSLIEKVDFSQKRDTIEKVFSITSSVNRFVLTTAIVLILVVILVVFNTIKLVVDRSREEINTMKIVGASSWFIRSPFIIQGALFGVVSFVICFLLTFLLSYFLTGAIAVIMPGFSLIGYFVSNFWLIILIQLGFGAGLGGFSSYLVVRRYLRV